MTSSKVEANWGEPWLFPILRLKSRKIEIYPIFPKISIKIGEIEILLDFALLLEENCEGFGTQKSRKVEEISTFPDFQSQNQGPICFATLSQQSIRINIKNGPRPNLFPSRLYPPWDILSISASSPAKFISFHFVKDKKLRGLKLKTVQSDISNSSPLSLLLA